MALPDEIVEDIFLRLDEADDLARASAVCTTFRRVAAAPGFLRRFRSLHPPPVLGLLSSRNHGALVHAEPPHRSAPAARALARAADFTFSFVPKPRDGANYSDSAWRVWDALDGRVLLSMNRYARRAFHDLVVCDPLHRRYVQIPPIPRDLVPSKSHENIMLYCGEMDFEHFLAPSSAEEQEKNELSFRVICNVRSVSRVVTLVFSSVTANWSHATSISFLHNRLIYDIKLFVRHYVRGCFYWACSSVNYMLLLNPREMKLMVVEQLQLPHGIIARRRRLAVVDAGEDKLGVIFVSAVEQKAALSLYYKTWWNNGNGAEDWQHKIVPLPERASDCSIMATTEGYLLLKVITTRPKSHDLIKVYYIMEVKTLLFERLPLSVMDNHPVCFDESFPPWLSLPTSFYASFPPPLSLPTI